MAASTWCLVDVTGGVVRVADRDVRVIHQSALAFSTEEQGLLDSMGRQTGAYNEFTNNCTDPSERGLEDLGYDLPGWGSVLPSSLPLQGELRVRSTW